MTPSVARVEANRAHVVLLGDSHFGRLGRIKLLEIEARVDQRALVHNHAFGGANSSHLAERVALEAMLVPAHFVVSVGTNDLAPWKRVPLLTYRANLAHVLHVLQPAHVAVLDLLPIDEAAPSLAGDPDKRTSADVARYRTALLEVVQEHGASLIRVAGMLGTHGKVHLDDGVHLNAAGTAVLLEHLVAHLQRLLD